MDGDEAGESICDIQPGHVAYMCFASTLVMLQTPGIVEKRVASTRRCHYHVWLMLAATGLSQAGIIRRKNVLSILMQTITGMVVGSVLWFIVGYTLVWGAFLALEKSGFGAMFFFTFEPRNLLTSAGPSLNGIIGHPTKGAFMMNVPVDTCVSAAPHIPGILFAAFQMMFALMTPVLVTGAWAEKLTFEVSTDAP